MEETAFNCPACKSRLAVSSVTAKGSISSLDDALLIAGICREKAEALYSEKTKESLQKSKQIIESVKNLLKDVLSLPDGFVDGNMEELAWLNSKGHSLMKVKCAKCGRNFEAIVENVRKKQAKKDTYICENCEL